MEKKFEFKPTQFVLVRDNDQEEWVLSIYSHRSADGRDYCGDRCEWKYIIPYQGNEHLIGTTNPYEPPYEPKDGDFVVCSKGDERRSIFIFEKMVDDKVQTYCIHFFEGSGVCCVREPRGFDSIKGSLRAATEKEKNLLLSKLHEIGKDWDAEKKEIVDWKWQPKFGNLVYFYDWCSQSCRFICCSILYDSTDGQTLRDKMGNCYRTNKECQAMCDKLNAAIKNVE